MAFLDFNESRIEFSENHFDIVIAGAGAAGILLAVELSKKGKKVLLLESGHFVEDESRQQLNTVSQSGKIVHNAVWGRKRAIGGSTIAWGGQSLPFSAMDFAERDWVQNSGWPIAYDELSAYYHRANRFMQVDEWDYEEDIFRLLRMKRAGFNQQLIRHHFSKWAPEPNFRIQYNDYLSKNVTVVYNCVLSKLHVGLSGKIESATISNFKGQSQTITTPQLVLATGAIEASRVLLNSEETVPGGIGNHSGWLGKCFMEHPCIAAGEIHTAHPWKMQSIFNTHIYQRRKYSIRLSLADACQRENKLLNGSASIMFTYAPEDTDPYAEIRKFIRTKKISSLKNFKFSGMNSYLLSATALTFQQFVYKHKARIQVVMMMEQEPDPESRITLTSVKDVHGMRQANIHWKVTRKTWDSVVYLANAIANEIDRLGLGKLTAYDHIKKNTPDWESYLTDVSHHMGGTRMSAKSEDGVVNRDLQVWGYDNLYLCSTSVFPTSSHSNPTLTLLALAQRLVDRLG